MLCCGMVFLPPVDTSLHLSHEDLTSVSSLTNLNNISSCEGNISY